MKCFKCEKELKNVFPGEEEGQPSGGTAFSSHGHYGSGAFDPMDGSYLELYICDGCLRGGGELVTRWRTQRPQVTREKLSHRDLCWDEED